MFITTGPILGRELITIARRAQKLPRAVQPGDRRFCSRSESMSAALAQYASRGEVSIHDVLAIFAHGISLAAWRPFRLC